MKQELAKQLLALRSSGENLLTITKERKMKDDAMPGSGSFEVQEMPLKASTNGFNLQAINQSMKNKIEETQ